MFLQKFVIVAVSSVVYELLNVFNELSEIIIRVRNLNAIRGAVIERNDNTPLGEVLITHLLCLFGQFQMDRLCVLRAILQWYGGKLEHTY